MNTTEQQRATHSDFARRLELYLRQVKDNKRFCQLRAFGLRVGEGGIPVAEAVKLFNLTPREGLHERVQELLDKYP